jgi:hypothetical protein
MVACEVSEVSATVQIWTAGRECIEETVKIKYERKCRKRSGAVIQRR